MQIRLFFFLQTLINFKIDIDTSRDLSAKIAILLVCIDVWIKMFSKQKRVQMGNSQIGSSFSPNQFQVVLLWVLWVHNQAANQKTSCLHGNIYQLFNLQITSWYEMSMTRMTEHERALFNQKSISIKSEHTWLWQLALKWIWRYRLPLSALRFCMCSAFSI